MVSTPLAGFVHFGDVVTNLAAAVAVTDDIAIDSGSVRLKSALTFRLMVAVSATWGAEGKSQPSDYPHIQRQSNPDIFDRHK
jgi:hypothetical protein